MGLVLVGFCLGLEHNSGWWHQESFTNLFFSNEEVDVTGRASFFSTFSKASFPSANLGKNDSIWLVCRHLFCFLKIGPYFHLSKRSPRSAVLISPSSWSQGPAFAKTASLTPWHWTPWRRVCVYVKVCPVQLPLHCGVLWLRPDISADDPTCVWRREGVT